MNIRVGREVRLGCILGEKERVEDERLGWAGLHIRVGGKVRFGCISENKEKLSVGLHIRVGRKKRLGCISG